MTREEQLELCAQAMAKFGPKFWCKPGCDFDKSNAIFWTGEGAIMPDGNQACRHFLEEFDLYPSYVHKDLENWAKENGFVFEFYDSSTLLGYKY